MRKLALIIAILFSGMLTQAQTDLDLADILIGKEITDLDSILTNSGFEYTITHTGEEGTNFSPNYDIYIESQSGGIKLWEVIASYPLGLSKYNKKVRVRGYARITSVFVRYRHSNIGDLRDFKLYEVPESNDTVEYEKDMGRKLSHLRITYTPTLKRVG